MLQSDTTPKEELSPRQSAVLECALRLLVEGGEKALTTAGIARAANCSKESLYKWFGDRNGILEAVVQFQASKVRTPGAGPLPPSRDVLARHLTTFAEDLLTVLSGEVSLALNRLAIGQASREEPALGSMVLDRGRRTIERRALALLEQGRQAGWLSFDDSRTAYETLYGLIVRDLHVRLLLGAALEPEARDFATQADTAINQFFRLYGRQDSRFS